MEKKKGNGLIRAPAPAFLFLFMYALFPRAARDGNYI